MQVSPQLQLCVSDFRQPHRVHFTWISWLFSQQPWLPHRDRWQHHLPRCLTRGHSTMNPAKDFITEQITFLFPNIYAISLCVIKLCVISLFFKKIDECGWKTPKSIILRSQVDHNIYNFQTWITSTNTEGKTVLQDGVITLKAWRMRWYYLC